MLITREWAWYNEIEEYAADWLENLIAAGHIAPGVVDRRSIEDVRPDDLRGFRQCHFFAGIGVWSYALRRTGVPDDTPLWTGSCPCQPFSAAGQGTGMDDERHLFPHWAHLIRQCRPRTVFGEQVASKDGLGWLDLVQADLEDADYAVWAVDTCSAGSGAPHIRQRLRFVAEDLGYAELEQGRASRRRRPEWGPGQFDGMGYSDSARSAFGVSEPAQREEGHAEVDDNGGHRLFRPGEGRPGSDSLGNSTGRMADVSKPGWISRWRDGEQSDGRRAPWVEPGRLCNVGRLADTDGSDRSAERQQPCGQLRQQQEDGCSGERMADAGRSIRRSTGTTASSDDRTTRDPRIAGQPEPGPTNGFWRDADWLFCRDGKWRPISAEYVEMVDGVTSPVGRGGAYVEDEKDAQTRMQAMLDTFGEEEVQRQAGRSWSLREENFLRPFLHGRLDGRSDQSLERKEQSATINEDGQDVLRGLPEDRYEISRSSRRLESSEQRNLEFEDVVRLLPQSITLAELHGRWVDASELRLLCKSINEAGAVCDASHQGDAAWASIGEDAKNRIRLGFDVRAWRRVVSFPLVDGTEFRIGSGHPVYEGRSRQGMLKAYGNAIDAEATRDFLEAYFDRHTIDIEHEPAPQAHQASPYALLINTVLTNAR